MNILEIIKKRSSCRSYTGEPVSAADKDRLTDFINRSGSGPFGSQPVFKLIMSAPGDSESLKGLGTYGFIRKPAGFIIGSITQSPMNLEDFGYCMEKIILYATEMGLGTCWLGGTFKKSRFADKAAVGKDRIIPAVAATGYAAKRKTLTEKIVRASAGADKRKSVHEIFFSSELERLDDEFYRSSYGTVLEMVRRAPSASNKQPWRIICGSSKNNFHLFLERTKDYNKSRFITSDLQRIDMGIAMCHFELAAKACELDGAWIKKAPEGIRVSPGWEYIASWH
ncbi:MAG: nitroreductase family protein [Proteobacteria bacterium]|nr:nitroreductase family protein [Pseudomonadota bacterium]MBU1388450.1 nitroreductase family protein [Pseudomonadota bacterium]MBU1542726.1 nitroreductase family protein [Pseudomonadota bacterium]MBU2481260.1 nitroreductase family protein [Pseudomonadota bacterium]